MCPYSVYKSRVFVLISENFSSIFLYNQAFLLQQIFFSCRVLLKQAIVDDQALVQLLIR